jgi:outer membrane immunogenic protein
MTIETKNVVLGVVAGAAAVVSGAAAASAADAGAVDDWSGFYVGGSVGYLDGSTPWQYGDSDYDMSGMNFGVHVGFNHQFDSLVVGVEAAYSSGATTSNDDGSYAGYGIGEVLDLKARAGIDMNGLLLYVTGGASSAKSNGYYNSTQYAVYGVNYGVGAEMKVTDSISIGAELLGRTLTGDYDYSDHSEAFDDQNQSHWQGMLRASYYFN